MFAEHERPEQRAFFVKLKAGVQRRRKKGDGVLPLENVEVVAIFIRMNVKFPGMYNENGEEMRWDNANGTEPTMGWNLFSLENIKHEQMIRTLPDTFDTGGSAVERVF